MKKLIFIVVFIILAGLAVRQAVVRKPEKEAREGEGLARVKVQAAVEREIRKELEFDGIITSVNEARVFADVPGIVQKYVKEPGDRVKKDEVILLLDRSQVGLEYAPAEVLSPVEGKLLNLLVDIGNRVSPQIPLAVVGKTDIVEARIDVQPEFSPYFKRGQNAEITVSSRSGEIFSGRVSRIAAALDPVNGKIPVRIDISNRKSKLIPGMVCVANVTVDSRQGVSVPVSAVLERNGKSGVFVIDDRNRAIWREVEVVLQGRDYAAVRGINEKTRVAHDGNYGLVPDSEVEIIE